MLEPALVYRCVIFRSEVGLIFIVASIKIGLKNF
jgi:hypothetical protein